MDGHESIPGSYFCGRFLSYLIKNYLDAFAKALSTNLIQSDVEQIVPLTLAKAGVDKRKIDAGTAGKMIDIADCEYY